MRNGPDAESAGAGVARAVGAAQAAGEAAQAARAGDLLAADVGRVLHRAAQAVPAARVGVAPGVAEVDGPVGAALVGAAGAVIGAAQAVEVAWVTAWSVVCCATCCSTRCAPA